ncbi:hypothetical protein ACGF0D_35155 [Kitasatospora sp. NPDC048298]|uniref:hypothetical protein n=1 Tax=Kitasatospora sp. NPDC048298 TaxID=3364049 RepID=UPI00371AE94D
MTEVEVPGPEPDWEAAPAYQGGKRNPAFQQSMWEFAASCFRVVAGLQPPLDALAARLRLTVERGWEDIGYVNVAMFRIGETDFALSAFEGTVSPYYTSVWVSRSEEDPNAALDTLLGALGIGREALAFTGSVEDGFENCNGWPG